MAAIVRDIVKKGLIAQDRGRWILTAPLPDIYPGIPETLQQMLEIQFEQLSEEEQHYLESCSVIGERFSVWAAAAMLDTSPISIEETCGRLAQRQQFIRFVGIHEAANGTDSAHYEFRHSLYRQALYRRLSSPNRSKLHQRLGEALMGAQPAGRRELASELALHFEQGRDYEQATRWLMLTAENDSRRFAHGDSIRVLQHALELASLLAGNIRPELEIQILQCIGDAHYALGAMSDSALAYKTAAARAAEAGLRPAQIDVLARLAVPAWYLDPTGSNGVCEQAIAVSREHGDPLLMAQAQLAAACFRLVYDAWRDEDAETGASAYRIIHRLSSADVPEDVLYAYVQTMQGHYEEALRHAESVTIATSNPATHLLAAGARILSLMLWGRFGEVLRIVRSGRELARKNGEDAWMFITVETWLRGLCFDFGGVLQLSKMIMRSDAEQHAAQPRTIAMMACGYAEIFRGRLAEALQFFAIVRDPRKTPKFFLHWHWRLHAELGATEAFLNAGDVANARRQADGFLQSALSTAEPNMQAHAWDVKSRTARAAKDFDSATECIHNALAILDRFEIPLAGWQVHRTAWNLYAALGDREKADRHRARAQRLIMSVADSFEPGEPLRESFLAAPPIRRIFEQYTSA
jgi:tetratricopeptide (TPR) repeat protein